MIIEFEGIDGAGKTTQCALLKLHLERLGIKSLVVKDLGDATVFGSSLASILRGGAERSQTAEMFSFLSCKAQLFSQVVRPSIEEGVVVICDRGIGSFLSYNSVSGNLPNETLEYLSLIATDGVVPDITILLDLPAEMVLERKGDSTTSFDKKGNDFFGVQRDQFLRIASAKPNWTIINALLPISDIQNRIIRITEPMFVCKESA